MENSKNNFVRNLYPVTKLTFVICIILSVFFVPNCLYSIFCFSLIILISIASGVFKQFIKSMNGIFILIVLIFIMQSIIRPGTEIILQWKFISVKKEGLEYAISLTSKILVIASAIALFLKSTNERDFVTALQQGGISYSAAYIILSTLKIVPLMQRKLKNIMEAQKSRGVETEGNLLIRAKAFVACLWPLVLTSMAGTEERVLALESRAFSAPVKKTYLRHIKDTKNDKILRNIFIAILIFIVVRRIILWIR